MVCHYNDKRTILNEIQKKIRALVIHQRYHITTLMGNVNASMAPSDNICVECTIIEKSYNVDLIMRYIMKNQNNVLVNLSWFLFF